MTAPTVTQDDARAMVRLLGETAALRGEHLEMRKFLLDGLSKLVDADAWVWSLSAISRGSNDLRYLNSQNSGFTEDQFAALLKSIEHPDMIKANQGFSTVLIAKGAPITMHRQQLDPDDLVYKGGARELWEQSGMRGLIFSGHPLDQHSFSTICLYRKAERPEFNERETDIAHIVLTEVPWLHATGWPEDRGASVPHLSPRQRSVMNLMLEGISRKQIAYHLEITENTVSGYVKEVYRHFGVNSQAELVSKFLRGTARSA